MTIRTKYAAKVDGAWLAYHGKWHPAPGCCKLFRTPEKARASARRVIGCTPGVPAPEIEVIPMHLRQTWTPEVVTE